MMPEGHDLENYRVDTRRCFLAMSLTITKERELWTATELSRFSATFRSSRSFLLLLLFRPNSSIVRQLHRFIGNRQNGERRRRLWSKKERNRKRPQDAIQIIQVDAETKEETTQPDLIKWFTTSAQWRQPTKDPRSRPQSSSSTRSCYVKKKKKKKRMKKKEEDNKEKRRIFFLFPFLQGVCGAEPPALDVKVISTNLPGHREPRNDTATIFFFFFQPLLNLFFLFFFTLCWLATQRQTTGALWPSAAVLLAP